MKLAMHTIMRTARLPWAAVLGALVVGAVPASAQQSESEFSSWRVPGWSVTPGIAMGVERDTNVALMDSGDFGSAQKDSLVNVAPFGSLEFISPRTEFSAGYRGFVRRYTEIDALNGFDQRVTASLRHEATKRLTVFLSNHFSDVPTTDEVELDGVPFLRTGAQTNNLVGGIDGKLNKFTDLSARYETTWVDFDDEANNLRGGWVNGISTNVKRRLSTRATVGGEYSLRFANVNDGARSLNFQDAGGTISYQTGPYTTLTAAAGISHLSDETRNETRTAPYFRGGITHHTANATFGSNYERTFVPSFGFGGANESQELSGFVHMPIPRNRAYVQGTVSWRRNKAFLTSLELDTIVARSTLGYALARWFRLEGSYAYSRQDSRITGGEIDRHRLGANVVIAQPMRIH